MSHRRPREQEWSAYDSDEDRRPRRSTRHRDPESEYIRPSGYESPPPNYSEAPRARDRGHSDRDDTRRQAPRHHSSDAYRSSAAPRRRHDNYPSDSEDSEEEYRRRSRRQKPREPDADRDRGKHYPPRAGGEAPRRGREGTYYPPRAGEARPAPPSRTRSWSETFAQSGAKDKVMAAGSAALAAGAAEAWRCRKDKGKLMEKGFKVGTAAAGAAAVAAFKNGGKEAEGRRRDDRDRDRDRGRRDDRYDDRYEERGGGGGGKTDAIKSAIGGILVSKMAKGFMGGK